MLLMGMNSGCKQTSLKQPTKTTEFSVINAELERAKQEKDAAGVRKYLLARRIAIQNAGKTQQELKEITNQLKIAKQEKSGDRVAMLICERNAVFYRLHDSNMY